MQYRRFIETCFLIDEPQTGKLVPFIFNRVQNKYYDQLLKDYDIEKKGVSSPVRDEILKARREGFSSLVLALFAADDILQKNPTETQVISYKDDATETFRKRYRNYLLSYAARDLGYTVEQVQANINILEVAAKHFLEVDSNDILLKHNKAHFYCGTASARVGGRGGVLQKLLFSEAAHYQDTDKMKAKEIIDGTLRQVDINSGWCFIESTANGYGNYYEEIWSASVQGNHRFKARFYGWKEFYTEEEFKLISSEFTDKNMLKQEYPATPEEAFIASGSSYFDNERILEFIKKAPEPIDIGKLIRTNGQIEFLSQDNGTLKIWEQPQDFNAYVIGGDVAEGKEHGDWSVLNVINNKTLKTVAKFKAHCRPDELAEVANLLGLYYNTALIGIEANTGLWVNTELFEKYKYPNLFYREEMDDITHRVGRKLGFLTSEKTRRPILDELQNLLAKFSDIWTNVDFLNECLVFVRNERGRPQAMNGKNDDEIFATAIAYEIRERMVVNFTMPEKQLTPAQNIVEERLNKLYNKNKNPFGQDFYI